MMQLLPTKGLDWVNPKSFNLQNYSDNGSKECFKEINLNYQDKLHDLHDDYTLAPKKIKITKEKVV